MKKFAQWVEANLEDKEVLRYNNNWYWKREKHKYDMSLSLINTKEEVKLFTILSTNNIICNAMSPNVTNYKETLLPVKYRGKMLDLLAFGIGILNEYLISIMSWEYLLMNTKLQEEICTDQTACKMFVDYVRKNISINKHPLNDYLQDTNRDDLIQCFLRLEQFLTGKSQ